MPQKGHVYLTQSYRMEWDLSLRQRKETIKARRSISASGIRQKIDYLLCNFHFCLCGTLIHADIFLFDH
jgi:hypothetical protein